MKYDYITCRMNVNDSEVEGKISGYGSIFGNEDSYGHTVEKGAFADSIKKRQPLMLYQHDWDKPLGKFTSLVEDDNGLYFDGEILTTTSYGMDAYKVIKAGLVTGMSIGGYIEDYEVDKNHNIKIKKFQLYEISPVTFPANEAARISSIKTINDEIHAINDLKSAESYLRETGLSKKEAVAIVSKIMQLRSDSVVENSVGITEDAIVEMLNKRFKLLNSILEK